MSAIRVKDATPGQIAVCRCDVCKVVIQRRGWIDPGTAQIVRAHTGSYVHGKCL